jgi:hypothetical protein
MSVVRATTATRVNSAGLVELVPYNLLEYSEQFNNAYWNATNAVVTSNTATAPNGTLTADTIAFSSGGYFGKILTSSGVHSYSVYAKYIGTQWLYVQNYNGNDFGAWFDIQNGVVGTIESGVTASIEQAENGFYRCTITMTASSSSSSYWVFFNTTGNGSFSRTGSAYFWGAQLVEGSTAKDYQKTETRLNIPRLDYSNGTCPSLLVEPQRTNVSQYVETGSASFNSATVVSASSLLGMTAFQVTTNIPTFGDAPYIFSNTNFAANTSYTFSFYTDFNQCSGTNVSASFLAFFPSIAYCAIDVDKVTKAITTTNVGGVWTINSYEAEQINGEIYRIYITATPNASGSGARNYLFGNPNLSSIKIAGVQLEAGSYATSYIEKTTSASVTRNADVISKTGISSLIGQTEGTIFIDTYIEDLAAQTNDPVLIYVKGTSADAYIEVFDNGQINAIFYDGSTSTGVISVNVGLQNGRHKFAFGYKDNNFTLFLDGTEIGTDTSGAVSGSLTEFGLNYYDNFYRGKQYVNAAALWKTRLTNTQLAQLTTI